MAKDERVERLPRKAYEKELFRLQGELVKLQEWVRTEGARVVVVFEGRDAAGKGSTIKRVSQYLNPRLARIAALPAPTERERSQWYFQRYIGHFPAAGEIVLFDRSWYNRAGVERVMGFCSQQEYMRFLHQCPIFERLLIEDGILLRKYWFSVSDREQELRFRSRLQDPMRRWKLSPMDLESISRWEEYSRAKDEMFLHTDIPEAPWHVVESEDKRRARINMIAHLISTVPYHEVQRVPLELPPRLPSNGYRRIPVTCRHTCPTTRTRWWDSRLESPPESQRASPPESRQPSDPGRSRTSGQNRCEQGTACVSVERGEPHFGDGDLLHICRRCEVGLGQGRLEQLDRVAGRIFDQDLPAPDTGDDVVAEVNTMSAQLRHDGVQVRDLELESVPAPGCG